MHHKKDIHGNRYLKSHLQFFSFLYCLKFSLNFHLQTIAILEKSSVTNIRLCNLTHKKKIRIKHLDLWAKNNPWNKKIRIDYINKPNATQIKTLEIKLVLWLAPFLPPKEMCVQTSLWLKWWPLMGGNGGKGKKQKTSLLNWTNLNLIFLLFSFLLCFQK